MTWIDPALPLAPLTDQQVLLVTLYGEARSEPVEGLIAVGCVIRNRVLAKQRGRTYREVCLSPWQFSCWNPKGGQRNYDRVATLVKRLAAGEAVTDPAVREIAYLAAGLMKDYIRDTVKGATHYHTATLQPRPEWARDVAPAVQRGSHVFYVGVK